MDNEPISGFVERYCTLDQAQRWIIIIPIFACIYFLG